MKDEAFVADLRGYTPEFFVVAAFGRILPETLLRVPSLAAVNLHASLLPLYRGASPIAWAILRGERETGLTTMLMSSGLDEGDILVQERFPIGPDDTTGSLTHRLAYEGGPLVLRTLLGMREGSIAPRPQRGETVYAPLLRKEDGRIPWSGQATEIERFVRAMSPWPGAFTDLGSIRLKVHRVRVAEGEGQPGSVLGISGEGMFVGTAGGGAIEILELQPPGKRPMSARAFLQGCSVHPGEGLT
jgi:methionyl-tRNA formyltransferase